MTSFTAELRKADFIRPVRESLKILLTCKIVPAIHRSMGFNILFSDATRIARLTFFHEECR